MSIRLPQQLGVILRKNGRTESAIAWLRQRNAHFESNEDEWLAGFWLAGSPQEAEGVVDQLEGRYGLRLGDDFVGTASATGIWGPCPDWVQEDEGDGTVFSAPGTAGPASTRPREAFTSSPERHSAAKDLIERTLAEQRANRG